MALPAQKYPVYNWLFETCRLCKRGIDMERVVVARDLSKGIDILLTEGSLAFRSLSDGELCSWMGGGCHTGSHM